MENDISLFIATSCLKLSAHLIHCCGVTNKPARSDRREVNWLIVSLSLSSPSTCLLSFFQLCRVNNYFIVVVVAIVIVDVVAADDYVVVVTDDNAVVVTDDYAVVVTDNYAVVVTDDYVVVVTMIMLLLLLL
jgi:hypothetical protein